jgi:hypothetical protein
MRIKCSINNSSMQIINDDGTVAFDYAVKEISVEGDINALFALGEEIGKTMAQQAAAQGFDVQKALEEVGKATKQ